MPSVQELTSPNGVIVILGAIVSALAGAIVLFVRDHMQADKRDRKRSDDNFLLARDAADGIKRLADVAERREKRDATREAERKKRDDRAKVQP